MADNVARYGFRHVRSLVGGTPSLIPCRVATGYQAAPGGVNCDLNVGDPVELLSTGYVGLAAASTGVLFGVIQGILPYWDGTKKVFGTALPGGTAYGTVLDRTSWVLVMPVQDQVFEIDQAATNASWDTEAEWLAFVGENADHIFTGVTATRKATPTIDISTHNTTATLQWRMQAISLIPGMDLSGANVKIEVTANVVRQAPYQTTGV